MGSSTSRKSTSSGASGHEQYAPMWVVKVEHVLAMTGRLRPHQDLKDEGVVVEHTADMFSIFVSHEWLGHRHPDPRGEQLAVLQSVLWNMMAMRIRVDNDVTSQFNGKHRSLTKEEHEQVKNAYIWLDYLSVPQLVQEIEMQGHEEEQLRYVQSIPVYVDRCELFLALVPQAVHTDTGLFCNYFSWLGRGWCRTEYWCKLLSPRSEIPIVAVTGPDTAKFTTPLWHRHPVHAGAFSFEQDRQSCSRIIERALIRRLSELRAGKGQGNTARLYLALYEDWVGLPVKRRSLDEFLADFGFPTLDVKGLCPATCAALTGDDALLRDLVAAKASLQTRAPEMLETLGTPDFSPLHFVIWFKSHDSDILETLLKLRADVHSSTRDVAPPLNLCYNVRAVELLVEHRAGVNFQGKHVTQWCPIHAVAWWSAPTAVTAKLLELRADIKGGRGGLASMSPLHGIAFSGSSENDLCTAQLLLEGRADINQLCQPEGAFRMFELAARASTRCRGHRNPSVLVRFLSNLSITPLGFCALFDNKEYMVFLLSRRADPEIRNNRGLRAIDFASSEIRSCLRDPSPHVELMLNHADPPGPLKSCDLESTFSI